MSGTAPPRWLTPDEREAWMGLVRVVMQLPAALDRQLREDAGIPHAHYQVLAMLSEAPGRAMRMSELARLTGTSQSRLSHAVAGLEQRGWVRRRTCETDRRGQVAELTADGVALLRTTAPGHVEQVRQLVFDPLDASEVAQLAAIAAKLLPDVPPVSAP